MQYNIRRFYVLIQVKDLSFPSATKECDIHARLWRPDTMARAVLQIAHGMAEHIERYDEFARYLCQNGIAVTANDHAGHGKSIRDGRHMGYFSKQNGWTCLINDMRTLYTRVKDEYPGVPYILLGHSMGSFLARTYASRHGSDIDAFIFSGTAGKNPALPIAGLIAKVETALKGAMTPSKTLDRLSFGAYNKAFQPNRTDKDWLCSDEAQVDRYLADPLCGFTFTAGGFRDLYTGLGEVSHKDWAAKVPDVPILMFAGDRDPVGANAKGVREVAQKLRQTGHRVELHIYEGGRHEMLNETNRLEVYELVRRFIDNVIENNAR